MTDLELLDAADDIVAIIWRTPERHHELLRAADRLLERITGTRAIA